ncbi:MAG: hypothetical protein JW864_03415 [Spirochaetes bacterium]|nr:hypothetical protein [Spirochaetota bacterium]
MDFLSKIRLIQGGMGVYISNWRLASGAVKAMPEKIAGTVSGTALDIIYPRILQDGDPDGHIKKAFLAFDSITGSPIGEKIYKQYFIPGGKNPDSRYKQSVMPYVTTKSGSSEFTSNPAKEGSVELTIKKELIELYIITAFSEVWLAKQGHEGKIFINFLKKIELPLIYSIYGAILAGADGVVIGAGNPDGMPEICSRLSKHQPVTYEPSVMYKQPGEKFHVSFDPAEYFGSAIKSVHIKKPAFLAIVTMEELANALANSNMPPDGFIIENYKAGGHNANPSGIIKYDELKQPIYGENDIADLESIKNTGLPFWLGGSYNSSEKLSEALNAGANGIQTGTVFAMSDESGMIKPHKDAVFAALRDGRNDSDIIRTTMYSPTGFSFKVVQLDDSVSCSRIYGKRRRSCDMGVLHQLGLSKADENGTRKIFSRCPASPLAVFEKHRGLARNAEEKRCLCNGLVSGAGFPQVVRDIDGEPMKEPSIVTLGENLDGVRRLSGNGLKTYNCHDIAEFIFDPAAVYEGKDTESIQ